MPIYPQHATIAFANDYEALDGTLSDYLQSAIGKALKEFIGDDRLAYMAMADDIVPAALGAFIGLDLNDYEKEDTK